MDAWRLLQGLNHMQEQPRFHFVRIGEAAAVGHEQVSNHALAAFVDKKRVANDSAAIDGSGSRQDFRIHVAQDHVSRTAVVPGEQARPLPDLVLQQWTQIDRGEMSEVENLHLEAPGGFRLAKRAHGGLRTASVVLRRTGGKRGDKDGNRKAAISNWHLATAPMNMPGDNAKCQLPIANCRLSPPNNNPGPARRSFPRK